MSTAQPAAQPSAAKKAETPLGQVSPKWAQAFILKQMFYRFQGARPDDQKKLEEAYFNRFGVKMRKLLPHELITAVYLEGPPGQGKTTVHRGAAREFAKLMGLKFHSKVNQHQLASGKIGANSFVFSVIELAGETSNKEVAGLMTKVKVGDTFFMGHLPDWRLAATMMSAYGYVLFDDFATATHQVQNSTLGLLLEGAAGDLQFNMNQVGQAKASMDQGELLLDMSDVEEDIQYENSSTVHFGLAGNRGARDGNKTFPITTATATRVRRFDVEDTVNEWCERALTDNNDEFGDCHMATFVEQNGDTHFLALAKQEKGMMGQSVVSRSLNTAMCDIRTVFAENGGLSHIMEMNEQQLYTVQYDIEKAAQGAIGKDAASALAVFYRALFLGAAPVAEKIMRHGVVDEDLIAEKYARGQTPDGQSFGYALASSLASFAAEDVVKALGGRKPTKAKLDALSNLDSDLSKQLRQVFQRFSYGINQFDNKATTTLAANQLMRRLAIMAPELFTGSIEFRVPTENFAYVLATGMFADNVRYRCEDNMEALGDSMSSYSAIFEGGFENDMVQKIGKLGAVAP
jgi:hypothetical protein